VECDLFGTMEWVLSVRKYREGTGMEMEDRGSRASGGG
jgi:hypothetical protein